LQEGRVAARQRGRVVSERLSVCDLRCAEQLASEARREDGRLRTNQSWRSNGSSVRMYTFPTVFHQSVTGVERALLAAVDVLATCSRTLGVIFPGLPPRLSHVCRPAMVHGRRTPAGSSRPISKEMETTLNRLVVKQSGAAGEADAGRASPPPAMEMSAMRALSWVSLGGGPSSDQDSDDPAPLVPGGLMRFRSPPRADQLAPVIADQSTSSDCDAILASNRRRGRRRGPLLRAPPTPSASSEEGEAVAAQAPVFVALRDVGSDGTDGPDGEGNTDVIDVERGAPPCKRRCLPPRSRR